MDEEKLPAELKLELLQAEKAISETMPKIPDWQRGWLTAAIAGAAFFAFGILARAPIVSSLGFALIGAITGLLVGAYRKPGKYLNK